MKPKILFDKAGIGFILEALGYQINEKGWVIMESSHVSIRAKDIDGNPFKAEDIIAIHKEGFITNIFQFQNLIKK